MDSLLGRWFSRHMVGNVVDVEGGIATLVPVHWLDVTPRESKDRPCTLESLEVEARVSGIFAQVTQTIVVANPNGRPISASFAIPLPDRAVVCGYALDIDGQMIEGVVVGKEKARVAFETEQRRGADPGLVEAVRGNVYRTRVYPVPAHGRRTLMLRYTAPLLLSGTRGATLDLPMPAEHLDRRSLRIEVAMLECPAPVISGVGDASMSEAQGSWTLRRDDRDLTPGDCVRISMPELPTSFVLSERDADGTVWFCASDEGPSTTEEVPALTGLTVLWDVSGSRAGIDHESELGLLHAYASAPTLQSIELVAFANDIVEHVRLASADELVQHVRGLRYDGGTSFRRLAEQLEGMQGAGAGLADGNACVLFTDGLDTLSDEATRLPRQCDALAIVSGVERDAEAVRQACGGRMVDLAVAPQDADGLMHLLVADGASRLLEVRGHGIADVCDMGTADGSRRAVIGRLTADTTTIELAEDGRQLALSAGDAREGSVLARAWAARRVSLLSPRADEYADELQELGRRFGVASPVTSLIVLETLDQWLRHDIEPPASWETMHAAWKQAMAGRMRLSSKEADARIHHDALVREWAKLLAWWREDYPTGPQPAPSMRNRRSGRMAEAGGMSMRAATSRQRSGGNDWDGGWEPDGFAAASLFDGMLSEGAFADSAPMPQMEPLRRMAAPSALRSPAAASAPAGDPMGPREEDPSVSVQVKAWMPNAPYLKALDEAHSGGADGAARDAYLSTRDEYRLSPSFFLDCAGWFLAHDDEDFGVRVLTNLAEMRIEDAALLRVLGWRLREAGSLEESLVAMRRVLRLRGEDSQSHRDVALVLSELAREAYAAGNEAKARAYAEEAGEAYRETALTPWQRRPMAIALFAVEEYNVLRAWAEGQSWQQAPDLPSLGNDLEGVLDCDLRVTLAWDADETDVDLHVTEPSGEEAYYAHRLTYAGGRVSEDITDGYGPELYEVRRAMGGTYTIRAHYFASHQQAIFGPATCTLTVFSDWGRPSQAQSITTTRLDKEREMVLVGTAVHKAEDAKDVAADDTKGEAARPTADESLSRLEIGMDNDQVRELMGAPTSTTSDGSLTVWTWDQPNGRTIVAGFWHGALYRVIERMGWGEDSILLQ